MTTLLDEPSTANTTNAASRLRATMAAVRIAFTWFGVRKTLSQEQKAQAADTFGAEGTYLSAAKKLLDTSHPAYRAVTGVRGRIIAYWKGVSLPYPEPGIRLIRQDDVPTFSVQFTTLKAELQEAVEALNGRYGELRRAARTRLGRLFSDSDYPSSLTGLFDVSYDFPSVEPPSYLRQLSPQLYEQESARIAARFDEAVQLAEQAFVGELDKLVSHLTERLSGTVDGQPKVFRDSAVENLLDFFDRFKHLNIRSNEQLDDLVARARNVVQGVEPQQLRDNQSLRQQVASQLAGVQSALDGMLVDRPRRAILRRSK